MLRSYHGALLDDRGSDAVRLQALATAKREGGWAMNNLDRYMEYLVAGVFLCVGLARILSYRRRPKPLGAQSASLPFGLPYGTLVAVGLFQIVAALILVTPFSFVPMIAPWAAAGLVFVTLTGALYHMRRDESAVPNLTLFLLVMFVVVGRWM
jgi:hypothetical protein